MMMSSESYSTKFTTKTHENSRESLHQNNSDQKTSNDSLSDNIGLIINQAKQQRNIESELLLTKNTLIQERKKFEEEKEQILIRQNQLIEEKNELQMFRNKIFDLFRISEESITDESLIEMIEAFIKEQKKNQKRIHTIMNEIGINNDDEIIQDIVKMKKQNEIFNDFSELKEIILNQSDIIKSLMQNAQREKKIKHLNSEDSSQLCNSLQDTNTKLKQKINKISKTLEAQENAQEYFEKSELMKVDHRTSPSKKSFKPMNEEEESANDYNETGLYDSVSPETKKIESRNNNKKDSNSTKTKRSRSSKEIKIYNSLSKDEYSDDLTARKDIIKNKNNYLEKNANQEKNSNKNHKTNKRIKSSSDAHDSIINISEQYSQTSIQGINDNQCSKQINEIRRKKKNTKSNDEGSYIYENKSKNGNIKTSDSDDNMSYERNNKISKKKSRELKIEQKKETQDFDDDNEIEENDHNYRESYKRKNTKMKKRCTQTENDLALKTLNKFKGSYIHDDEYYNMKRYKYDKNKPRNNLSNNYNCAYGDYNNYYDSSPLEVNPHPYKHHVIPKCLMASEIENGSSEESHFDEFGATMWMAKTRDLLSLERQLLHKSRMLNEVKNEQIIIQTNFQRELKMHPETML